MKGWIGLACLLVLMLAQVLLVEHLASQDSAAVLLASWDWSVALEFLATLGLRLGLYLLGPALLVVLLAQRLGADQG